LASPRYNEKIAMLSAGNGKGCREGHDSEILLSYLPGFPLKERVVVEWLKRIWKV
jgi:hypothetical protein